MFALRSSKPLYALSTELCLNFRIDKASAAFQKMEHFELYKDFAKHVAIGTLERQHNIQT